MTPVGHTSHSLDATRTVRRTRVVLVIFFVLVDVEMLTEALAHGVPALTVGVAHNGFVRRDVGIVRECEPVEATRTTLARDLQSTTNTYASSLY